jgi:hypothetical protein
MYGALQNYFVPSYTPLGRGVSCHFLRRSLITKKVTGTVNKTVSMVCNENLKKPDIQSNVSISRLISFMSACICLNEESRLVSRSLIPESCPFCSPSWTKTCSLIAGVGEGGIVICSDCLFCANAAGSAKSTNRMAERRYLMASSPAAWGCSEFLTYRVCPLWKW